MIEPVRLSAILLLLGSAVPAFAQSPGDNLVFLGQTGDTNTVRINQTGNGNVAGADAAALRLNQLGRDNTLEIDQIGLFNQVGSDPRSSSKPAIVHGTNQVGTRNQISIDQTTGRAGSGNRIGSVLQVAPDLGPLARATVANAASIVQDEVGGAHRVGQVVQKTEAPDGAMNVVDILQTGGERGLGNSLRGALQSGTGNSLASRQSASENAIGGTSQTGNANEMRIDQADGAGNVIERLDQAGERNRMEIAESGARNFIARASQNNQGIAVSGNTMRLTLSGNDNGGNGLGLVGSFTGISASAEVMQATVEQFGDGNVLSYTVSSAKGVQPPERRQDAMLNLFGFVQDGSGNGLSGTVTGAQNQAAARQQGDGNGFDFQQVGIGNALSVRQIGERNRADAVQQGDGNQLTMAVRGDDNNSLGSAFTGQSLNARSLQPGELQQIGDSNVVDLAVEGSRNLFAAFQSGSSNTVTGSISGASNQASLSQLGNDNLIGFTQSGSANILVVEQ